MLTFSGSKTRRRAVPIAPDELSTCSSAGDTFSRNRTAPSAANKGAPRASFQISITASRTRITTTPKEIVTSWDFQLDRHTSGFFVASFLNPKMVQAFNPDPGPEGERVASAISPHSHCFSFDHRCSAREFLTAIANAFLCPTSTTRRLPRVIPV
jgi:hypothetical protein